MLLPCYFLPILLWLSRGEMSSAASTYKRSTGSSTVYMGLLDHFTYPLLRCRTVLSSPPCSFCSANTLRLQCTPSVLYDWSRPTHLARMARNRAYEHTSESLITRLRHYSTFVWHVLAEEWQSLVLARKLFRYLSYQHQRPILPTYITDLYYRPI